MKWKRIFLSPWALVLSVLLIVGLTLFAGVMGMMAEDHGRDPTLLENALFFLPWIPAIWLVLILWQWILKK